MNYGEIKKIDIANGPGCRTSLFVSGCTHHCLECFQPQTWDFDYGKPFDDAVKQEIMQALKPEFIAGFSLLGGEPFEPANQKELAGLLEQIKTIYPEKDIWCWTGSVYEEDLKPGGKLYSPYAQTMLENIDVLVDGPFIAAQKNLMLAFRGSENQRLIDLKKTLVNPDQQVVLVNIDHGFVR